MEREIKLKSGVVLQLDEAQVQELKEELAKPWPPELKGACRPIPASRI